MPSHYDQEGEGFKQQVLDFTRQIFKGRDKLAANSQTKLDKWGDSIIEGVKIVRKPIMPGINKLANLLTKGKFEKDMLKNGYDDLFHLRVDLKLKGGPCLTIEKNESVAISRGKCENINEDGLEAMDIEVKKEITLKDAYEKMTKAYPTPKNLYDYDSVNNNCQIFVDRFLSKNKDAFDYTADDKKFVKQDVKFVLDNYMKLKKGAKVITNLAQRLSLFITGAGEEEENKILDNNIQMSEMTEMDGEGILSIAKKVFKKVKKGMKKVDIEKIIKETKKGIKTAKEIKKVYDEVQSLLKKENKSGVGVATPQDGKGKTERKIQKQQEKKELVKTKQAKKVQKSKAKMEKQQAQLDRKMAKQDRKIGKLQRKAQRGGGPQAVGRAGNPRVMNQVNNIHSLLF
jgi:hypothetical protein